MMQPFCSCFPRLCDEPPGGSEEPSGDANWNHMFSYVLCVFGMHWVFCSLGDFVFFFFHNQLIIITFYFNLMIGV